MAETAAARYTRDYGSMSTDRKDRDLDTRDGYTAGTPTTGDRTDREYVNDANSTTAVDKTN